MTALAAIVERIRTRGPITVAEFMEIALYDPEHGYYAGAAQRSGREGDFFTNVDVGPLFGELLAVQLGEIWDVMRTGTSPAAAPPCFDLVEVAAGNGRLSRDILDATEREHPDLHAVLRLTLVERSAPARDAQPATLGRHATRLHASTAALPSAVTGVIFANELLDAFPVHVVTMTESGLREIHVAEENGALRELAGEPSTAAIEEYLSRAGARLEVGARAEVNLRAIEWVEAAAHALSRGCLLLVDYGHTAGELYSATHASGTLMAYRRHTAGAAGWLRHPGLTDLTSHVDFTSVRLAAERAGLQTLGIIDQTYFLTSLGLAERLGTGDDSATVTHRLAAKTLVMPGGLGSTMKVLGFAKNIGRPALRGFSSGRLT